MSLFGRAARSEDGPGAGYQVRSGLSESLIAVITQNTLGEMVVTTSLTHRDVVGALIAKAGLDSTRYLNAIKTD